MDYSVMDKLEAHNKSVDLLQLIEELVAQGDSVNQVMMQIEEAVLEVVKAYHQAYGE